MDTSTTTTTTTITEENVFYLVDVFKEDERSLEAGVSELTIEPELLQYTLTDLIGACRRGELERVKEILKTVNVNEQAEDGYTALYVSCLKREYDVIAYLVECGADFNIRQNDDLNNSLSYARSIGDYRMVRILTNQTPREKSSAIVTDDFFGVNIVCETGVSGVCSICFEEGNLEKLVGCGHIFCEGCITEQILTHTKESRTPACPFNGCKKSVCFYDIQRFLVSKDKTIFDRYVNSLTDRYLASLSDWRWCAKCGSGGLITSDVDCVDAQCAECGYAFCTQCLLPAHPTLTCEQNYDVYSNLDISVLEIKYKKWTKKNSKACPSCNVYIEKNGGCSHITCKNCTYQFCWICRGPYKGRYVYDSNVCPCKGAS